VSSDSRDEVQGVDRDARSVAGSKRYWAFISYSYADRAWAYWLHKSLERYRIPRRLVGVSTSSCAVPTHLVPVFLDRIELAAGHDLDTSILDALSEAHSLIVICSPSATRSERVIQEIKSFRDVNPRRVLSLIVAGRPNAAQRGGSATEECFPAPLRGGSETVDDAVRVPLAADVRPGKGGRQEALLKMIAGVLDVNLDQLRQRDLQRRRRKWMVTSAVSLIVMVCALALAFYAWNQRNAVIEAQSELLTQTAFEYLRENDVSGAQSIILEVLKRRAKPPYSSAEVNVFEEIRAADPELAVLAGHGNRVGSAVYSLDGTRIVTASNDKTARIWDAQSGAQLAILYGHTDRVDSVAYSPDGKRIVTASSDKTARIWDANTGLLLAVLSGHRDVVRAAGFSPDGARVLTASYDNTARLWDSESQKLLAILAGHTGRVTAAAFSADGSRIVTASDDKTARLWNGVTGTPITVLSGHLDSVLRASFSPDGRRIVTASQDKTARIWDTNTGAQLAILLGHSDTVRAAAFSPDGTRIVTTSQDGTGRIWDTRTGTEVAALNGHSSWVISAAYSPDGTEIATTSADQTARIWDARTGAPLAILSGHTDHVLTAAFSPDGRHVLTSSEDYTARIWQAVAGGPLQVFAGHSALVDVNYSPDGAHIVTASYDKTARIWDARSGTQIISFIGHREPLNGAAYSPDGKQIVTASRDETARIWDARTGAPLVVLAGHRSSVEGAAFSPDGTRIVTASQDNTARIWDATGQQLAILAGHGDRVNKAAFSPDSERIVTASFDRSARIWDARTGVLVAVLSGHTGTVNSATFSPDGGRVLTAADDKTARIWDARTGEQLAVLAGHRDKVASAAYSRDGTRIVTASNDKTARIWDARTGNELAVFSGHTEIVMDAAFSPDATRIVTASFDNTARIWAVDAANLSAQLAWYGAAQFDPLSDQERAQLGLSPNSRDREWPASATPCDRSAAAFYDPDRWARGVAQMAIASDVAEANCALSAERDGREARWTYQEGRALLAKHDVQGAIREFQVALSEGHRAARIDLADLLVDDALGVVDPRRAASLYEGAWRSGVPIAAFKLGQLYEKGAHEADTAATVAFHGDLAKAWYWYEQGADAGEPNALARFAQRDEQTAAAETSPSQKNALLLQAFSYYAAASDRAGREDWPENVWSSWRYRRATLARVLAREGLIEPVANAYQSVLAAKNPAVSAASP
jgi:WD40 repeat protein